MKHIHERFLPDKAIDVIDEAGAFVRLQQDSSHLSQPNVNPDNASPDSDGKSSAIIDVAQIEYIVSKLRVFQLKNLCQPMIKALTGSWKVNFKHLRLTRWGDQELSGCHQAVSCGAKTDDKPIGSFMFAGSTGVGKTEVSRQLANLLGIELVRFDMSEYMEAHTASRLIARCLAERFWPRRLTNRKD